MLEIDQLYTVFQASKSFSNNEMGASRASDNVDFHFCSALSIPQQIVKRGLNQRRFVVNREPKASLSRQRAQSKGI